MSVPEGRFQKPQLFLHPDCEKHHIWWCSKMWFGPGKLLRKVTNPWAARLTRSRSVRCSAPTDHELMILLLSSASALARLPAFLRTPSRICSSLGLASVNTLPISAECLRKIGTIRSLPLFVSATTRTLRSSGLSARLTSPLFEQTINSHADGTRREVDFRTYGVHRQWSFVQKRFQHAEVCVRNARFRDSSIQVVGGCLVGFPPNEPAMHRV